MNRSFLFIFVIFLSVGCHVFSDKEILSNSSNGDESIINFEKMDEGSLIFQKHLSSHNQIIKNLLEEPNEWQVFSLSISSKMKEADRLAKAQNYEGAVAKVNEILAFIGSSERTLGSLNAFKSIKAAMNVLFSDLQSNKPIVNKNSK